MPYLRSLFVHNSRAARDFALAAETEPSAPFRHLVLTGRNGSGKSSILEAIHHERLEGPGARGARASQLSATASEHQQRIEVLSQQLNDLA